MLKGVFSIRDLTAKRFLPLTLHDTVPEAIRSFSLICKQADVNDPLRLCPKDFELYCVGVFDSSLGTFQHDSDHFPEGRLCGAVEFVPPPLVDKAKGN